MSTVAGNLGPSGSLVTPFYWANFLRERMRGQSYWRPLTTKVTIPQGYGFTVRIPRFSHAVKFNSAALVQWAPSAASAVTQVNFTASVANESGVVTQTTAPAEFLSGALQRFHGAYRYTDAVTMGIYANFLSEAAKGLGADLAFKIDKYIRTTLSAGAIKVLSESGADNAGTSAFNDDLLRGKDLAKLAPRFEAAGLPPWDDGYYIAMIHPYAKKDLWADTSANGLVQVYRYQDSEKVYKGEMGKLYGMRILASPFQPRFSGGTAGSGISAKVTVGTTGTHCYAVAPEFAYGVEHAKGGLEIINHPLGSGGATGDATNILGSIGVKYYFGCIAAAATDGRLIRLAHALSMRG